MRGVKSTVGVRHLDYFGGEIIQNPVLYNLLVIVHTVSFAMVHKCLVDTRVV